MTEKRSKTGRQRAAEEPVRQMQPLQPHFPPGHSAPGAAPTSASPRRSSPEATRAYWRKRRAAAKAGPIAEAPAPAAGEPSQAAVEAFSAAAAPFHARAILEEIASDRDAPAGARVAAAIFLITKSPAAAPGASAPADDGLDPISRRALETMRRKQMQ